MRPDGRFEGRTALVTGAGGGIGGAVAARFATEGAVVVAADRDPAAAARIAARIRADGGQCHDLGCDVRREDQVRAAVAAALDRTGRLDLLVCAAGMLADNLLADTTDDDWDMLIGTHLTGAFRAARAAHGAMLRQRYGRMVFLSSVAVFGSRGQAGYASAKAGVQALARTLALELAPFGVTVNCVAPGFVDTAMTRSVAERSGVDYEELKRAASAATPVRRVASAQEMAAIIAFLCSDEAGFVTGQTIVARGGP